MAARGSAGALDDSNDLSSLVDQYLPRNGRASADSHGGAARELVDMLKSTQARPCCPRGAALPCSLTVCWGAPLPPTPRPSRPAWAHTCTRWKLTWTRR